MKKILLAACLLLAVLAGFAQDAVPADAFEKGMKQPDIQLLDVRTAKEFNTGHLQDALQADFTKKKEFFDRIKYLDKSKPVYIYCLSGGRSSAAAKWMRENGYAKVVEMEGGVIAWKQAGKALTGGTTGPQFSIPDFEKAVSNGKWVLVDVGATWCPPCRKMEPVVKQIVKEKQLKLVNVDAGKDTDVMNSINAKAPPTFVLYKDGKEVWRKEGVVTLEELRSVIR
jgi:rhodanese-related sulfurtransferase